MSAWLLTRARRLFMQGSDTALQALLPRVCALCESELDDADTRQARLCAPCRNALPGASGGRCLRCALHHPPAALCPLTAAPWDAALAWVDYAYPVDGWVHALKFQGEGALAEGLGNGLARTILCARQRWEALTGPIDAIVPLPLSPSRLARRGFNQAALIAEGLARAWQLQGDGPAPPLRPGWLIRRRDAGPLSGQGAAARADMIRGAYQAGGKARSRPPGKAQLPLRGQRLLLVDDVMTTGASLAEATLCLKAAGALAVVVAAAARTPATKEGQLL